MSSAHFTPTPATLAFFNDLALIGRLSPTSSDLAGVSEVIRRGFAENFANESAGDIAPWQQLSPRTIIERINQGYPGDHPILVRSGAYRASFVEANAPGHVEDVSITASGFTLEVGSSDDRADILEYGLGNIPERPVTILSSAFENEIGLAFEEVLSRLLFG